MPIKIDLVAAGAEMLMLQKLQTARRMITTEGAPATLRYTTGWIGRRFRCAILGPPPYDRKALGERFAWLQQTDFYRQNRWRATAKFWWWILREHASRELIFRTADGVSLASMPANWSSMAMYLLSDRDPEIQSVIRRLVPAGGVFVDVGANIGTYTVRASQVVGLQGRVVAIEAHPVTFGFLQRTIALNGFHNVTALNIAVGDTQGTVRVQYTPSNPGETHVSPSGNADIAMTPLDGCMTGLGITAINYLKIDVEGYELFVLRGARRIIEASRDIVVQIEQVERHARRYGHSVGEAAELLASYGLRPHFVDKAGVIHAATEPESHSYDNYLWAFRDLSDRPVANEDSASREPEKAKARARGGMARAGQSSE